MSEPDETPPHAEDEDVSPPEHEEASGSAAPGLLARLRKRLLQLIAILALLVVAFAAFSQTSYFRNDLLRPQLIASTNDILAGSIDVGSIEGSLFTRVAANDLRVYDARGNLAASIERAEVAYSLLPLLESRLPISYLRLVRPFGIVHTDRDGVLNLGLIAKPSEESDEESSPFGLEIKQFEVEGGVLLYIDERDLAPNDDTSAAAITNFTSTLKDQESLLDGKLPAWAHAKMRALNTATIGPTPGAALIDAIDIAGNFSLDKRALMTVDLKSLGATLDANTWVGEQPLESKNLLVKYGPEVLRITHDSLRIDKETGWRELKLGANLTPATTPDEAPGLELFHASSPEITITRDLVLQVAPSLDLRDGLTAELVAGGTPKDARAMLRGNLIASGGKFHAYGRIEELLSQLLSGALSFEDPNATRPLYSASIKLEEFDPGAIAPDVPHLILNGMLNVEGSGVTLESAKLKAKLDMGSARALEQYELRSAMIEASFEDKKLTISPSHIRSPYLDANIEGYAELGGELDMKLSVVADERHDREFSIPGVGKLKQQHLTLGASATGKLDLETQDPVAMVRDMRLLANWDVADLYLEEDGVGESKAKIDMTLTSPAENKRHVDYDVEVSARDLSAPSAEARAQVADIDSEGEFTFNLPLDDPLALLDSFKADARIKARGVSAPGVSVSSLDANATLAPTGRGRSRYTLNASGGGIRLPDATFYLGGGSTDLTGEVSLDDEGAPSYVSARGSARVRSLDAAGNTIEKGDVAIDVSGRPPNLYGSVELDARGLAFSDQKLEEATLTARLKADQGFEVSGEITRVDAEPKRLKVAATGKVSSEFDEISDLKADLYNLDAKEDEPVWKIEDATIVARNGEVKFEKVALVNDEQRLEVSGVYRERGAQDLEVSANKIDLGQLREELGLQKLLPDIKGQIEKISFTLAGTSKKPEIALDVIVREFYYEGTGPFELTLKGTYKKEKLTIRTIDLDGWGSNLLRAQARVPVKLDLEGNIDIFWQEPILMSLFIDPIDLGELTPRVSELDDYRLWGTILGGGIINGTLEKPTLDLSLAVKELGMEAKVSGEKVDLRGFSMASRFEYEPVTGNKGGFKTKTTLTAEQPGQQKRDLVTLSAQSPLPIAEWLFRTVEKGEVVDYAREVFSQPFSLTMRLDKIKLEQLNKTGLLPQPEFGGEIDFTLMGAGTFGDPSMRFDLNLSDVLVQGEVSGQQLDLRAIDASTTLTFGPLQASPNNLVFDSQFSRAGEKLLSSKGFIGLPLPDWFERIALKGEELDFQKEMLDKKYKLDLDVWGLDLSQIAIAPLFTEPDIAGILEMQLVTSGTLSDPSGTLTLDLGKRVLEEGKEKSVGGFGYERYRDIVISAKASIEKEVLSLDRFDINWDSTDILSASGKVPLPVDTLVAGAKLEDLPLDFDLELHPVPLNKLSAVDYSFASLSGALNGHILGRGSLRAPDLSGRIALVDTRLSGSEKGTIAADFSAREGVFEANTELCQDKYKMLTASLAARLNTDILAISEGADITKPPAKLRTEREDLPANRDLHLKVGTREGRPIDLARALPQKLLKAYAKDIEGLLTMSLDMMGTYDAITANGTFKLDNGAITLESYGRRFEEITIDTWMDSAAINVREISLVEGDASVSLNGRIAHENLSPGEIKASLDMKEFNVGDFVDFPFFASGHVETTGNVGADPIKLRVDMSKLDVALTEEISNDLHPTELSSDIVIVRAQTSSTAQVSSDEVSGADIELLGASGGADALRMNVRVTIADDSWVRHPYGDVNIKGDFTTILDGPKLAMTGQVETLRGEVEFLEKNFTVTRGIVTFTGADPPDPRLQIEASYLLDRAVTSSLGPASDGVPRVIVAVEGSANDPVLRLRSDPSMSETDILYVLATGQPPESADVGQDSSVASAALSAASGVVLGMLRDELSDTLPLDFFDVLRVDTSNLEVGKYINNGKIYLSYRYLFGGGADQSGESVYEFEYHFKPKWTLEAQGRDSDQGGQFHFNVFWDAY